MAFTILSYAIADTNASVLPAKIPGLKVSIAAIAEA